MSRENGGDGWCGKEVQSSATAKSGGLPFSVLILVPADKPDLLDLHTHRPSSTVGISEEYVNSPADGWRV